MSEKSLILGMRVLDFFLLIRIPSVIASCLNTRGLRCYYNYRVVTMIFLLVTWIAGFIVLIMKNVNGQIKAHFVVIEGIGGGLLVVVDFFFNKILRRKLLRTIRSD